MEYVIAIFRLISWIFVFVVVYDTLQEIKNLMK